MADLVQLEQTDITRFINGYESLNEFILPKRNPGYFTYHQHKAKNGKYLDDGKCECCGQDRQYLLIQKDLPRLCYRCYQACRGYSNLLFDPLKLKKKRKLEKADCKNIVKYMNKYSKQKLVAMAAVGLYLLNKK